MRLNSIGPSHTSHLRFRRKVKHEHAEEGDDHDGEDDVGQVEERLGRYHPHMTSTVSGSGGLPEAEYLLGTPLWSARGCENATDKLRQSW